MFRTQVNGIKGCRLRISIRNSIVNITYSQLAQVVIIILLYQTNKQKISAYFDAIYYKSGLQPHSNKPKVATWVIIT